MYTIKAWWAGRVVYESSISSLGEVKSILQTLQQALNKKAMQTVSCGVVMTIDSLCVDVLDHNGIIQMYNMKMQK